MGRLQAAAAAAGIPAAGWAVDITTNAEGPVVVVCRLDPRCRAGRRLPAWDAPPPREEEVPPRRRHPRDRLRPINPCLGLHPAHHPAGRWAAPVRAAEEVPQWVADPGVGSWAAQVALL